MGNILSLPPLLSLCCLVNCSLSLNSPKNFLSDRLKKRNFLELFPFEFHKNPITRLSSFPLRTPFENMVHVHFSGRILFQVKKKRTYSLQAGPGVSPTNRTLLTAEMRPIHPDSSAPFNKKRPSWPRNLILLWRVTQQSHIRHLHFLCWVSFLWPPPRVREVQGGPCKSVMPCLRVFVCVQRTQKKVTSYDMKAGLKCPVPTAFN